MLAIFQAANFITKSVITNPMLKLFLTLAAVFAIVAAVPSDTEGLGFQDLQDSDADDFFADLSDELDLDDDEVAKTVVFQPNDNNGEVAKTVQPNNNNGDSEVPKRNKPRVISSLGKHCCKPGDYGKNASGGCRKCGSGQTSPTTQNGMTDPTGRCPNEEKSSCKLCGICETFNAATGRCDAKCSGLKRNCKTSGANAGTCT